MYRKTIKPVITVAFISLILLIPASLFAQLSTGKIEGIVRDKETGQPLYGAQITVEGTRLGNVTNADGYYFLLDVPPGRRSITFIYTGYQKTTVAGQLILAGQTTTINANLSSTVVELMGITVEGESEILVPRDNTSTKQRLTAERLKDTPATRLEDLLIQEAGIQSGGRDALSRSLRIRGGRMGEESMVVDGVMLRNFTANPFRTGSGWIFDQEVGTRSEDETPLEFSTASLEEVDVITGGFQAEYGNAQSGIINIVTKEGGAEYKGSVRHITDEINPRTADYGYNQTTASIGGPVKVVPNMYFQFSGEIQGQADRTPTHADEGFRAIDQTFVDRLNDAVRNDPVLSLRNELPFTLEKFQIGRKFYASKTGQSESLFSAPNPVRLPHNWGDRTIGSGKTTYYPFKGLKLLATLNRSRVQHSYPNGWAGEGTYFQNGIFYKGDPAWDTKNWGADTSIFVHQAYARKVRSSNFLLGSDWELFRNAERSASIQFRYSFFKTVEISNSSIKNNWERDTFMGWSQHDVPFEVERYPNRENPTPDRSWFPDGAVAWKQSVTFETPLNKDQYSAYWIEYDYLRERQHNYKVDVDLQLDRHNRAKLGFQLSDFRNLSFDTNYNTPARDPLTDFKYNPQVYGTFIQNRTDLGDFVFDYGLRYDRFVPRSNWGITRTNPWGETVHPRIQDEISPRFDVGFPVTDKAQLRFSYGVFTQLPSFDHMFGRGSNTGGLGYSRTDAFEMGLSYMLSNDMVLDYVTYYRDVDGNVANKEYFEEIYYWHTQELKRHWMSGITNRDNGNIKGFDLTLKKRFSDNYSFNLMYTMQFSRTTGSAYNSPSLNPSLEGNFDPATGAVYIPPDELRPIDGDQTHKFAAQFNYSFPEDYRAGTLVNKILKNFRSYASFNLTSGEPLRYSLYDDTDMLYNPSGTRIGGLNFFRGRWNMNLDLRFTKTFNMGKSRNLSVFTEIFNATNCKINRQYPSGYRLDDANFNDIGGEDLIWDEVPVDNFNRARFNCDFNGDGVLTVEEAALGNMAISMMNDTMDKRQWGQARQIRTGLEFNF